MAVSSPADLLACVQRLDIKINNDLIEPLALIVHRDAAYRIGRSLVSRLKETIPRQQFKIPVQACLGSRVIAGEAIPGEKSRCKSQGLKLRLATCAEVPLAFIQYAP